MIYNRNLLCYFKRCFPTVEYSGTDAINLVLVEDALETCLNKDS